MVGDDVVTLLFMCVWFGCSFYRFNFDSEHDQNVFHLIYCIAATVLLTNTNATAQPVILHLILGWNDKHLNACIWLLFVFFTHFHLALSFFTLLCALSRRPYANYTLWPEPNDYAISTYAKVPCVCVCVVLSFVFSSVLSLSLSPSPSFSKVHTITFNIPQILLICINGAAAPVSCHIILVVFQLSRSKHMRTALSKAYQWM